MISHLDPGGRKCDERMAKSALLQFHDNHTGNEKMKRIYSLKQPVYKFLRHACLQLTFRAVVSLTAYNRS